MTQQVIIDNSELNECVEFIKNYLREQSIKINNNVLNNLYYKKYIRLARDMSSSQEELESKLRKIARVMYKNALEINDFIKSIEPNIFITINFNNNLLPPSQIKSRVRCILKNYYKKKYGYKKWVRYIKKGFGFKFFLFLETGVTNSNNHCHILLNSRGLSKEELKSAFSDVCISYKFLNHYKVYTKSDDIEYASQLYNGYDINDEETNYQLNSILIEDIEDIENMCGYVLKEIDIYQDSLRINFDSLIPYNEIFTD